jgi:hypothetical protein
LDASRITKLTLPSAFDLIPPIHRLVASETPPSDPPAYALMSDASTPHNPPYPSQGLCQSAAERPPATFYLQCITSALPTSNHLPRPPHLCASDLLSAISSTTSTSSRLILPPSLDRHRLLNSSTSLKVFLNHAARTIRIPPQQHICTSPH